MSFVHRMEAGNGGITGVDKVEMHHTALKSNGRDSGDAERVAVVSGGASGIGRATVIELSQRGFRVGIIDNDSRSGSMVVQEVGESGGICMSIECDVTKSTEVNDAVNAIVDEWSQLDAVVTCAGVEVLGDVVSLTDEDWTRALEINLGGTFRIARATLPHLIKSRGSIVAVASDAGVHGAQGYAAYVAAKHGVVGLIRCLALDFGPLGVRSSVVCPGFVNTPMAERIFSQYSDSRIEYFRSTIPMQRFAEPAEIAKSVAHLLSDEASYTNGLVYNVDGGFTAGYFHP